MVKTELVHRCNRGWGFRLDGRENNSETQKKMKQVVILILLVCLSGCITPSPQSKLKSYGCWWDCVDAEGNTGFCCEKEVPEEDHYIFDCKYAEDVVITN